MDEYYVHRPLPIYYQLNARGRKKLEKEGKLQEDISKLKDDIKLSNNFTMKCLDNKNFCVMKIFDTFIHGKYKDISRLH
jgi:hypothetical protein